MLPGSDESAVREPPPVSGRAPPTRPYCVAPTLPRAAQTCANTRALLCRRALRFRRRGARNKPCTRTPTLQATLLHSDRRPMSGRRSTGGGVRCKSMTLKEAFSVPKHTSAMCVQSFDDSLNSAIHTTYRISLRSSSLREPRYPLLRVLVACKDAKPAHRGVPFAVLRSGSNVY